ncbi:MAG: exonuclease SbcCD subunit D [Actinomycetota bacterium]|nr:exonuclease SbcCD subunit D [Actinomycetota bacterium]
MRLLHTSDWHLGRSLHRADLRDAQAAYLDHLVQTVRAEKIDAVLVAGDVYDRAIPPLDAVKMFESALVRIRETGARVVLISGNHDSAQRLGFSSQLLDASGVHLRTRVAETAQPVLLQDRHGPVAVYGIPYLEPEAVADALPPDPAAVPGVDAPAPCGHAGVLGRATSCIRADATRRGVRSVVLAHGWVHGGAPSDSERDITVGGVGAVSAELFSDFSYTALGHLHGPQVIRPELRYSGSPLPYSFSEAGHRKGSWLVELGRDGLARVEHVPAPVHRRLSTLRGPLDELLRAPEHGARTGDFVSITLTDAARPTDAMARLAVRFPHLLVLSWEPEGAVDDGLTYSSRLRGRNDVEVAASFVRHVRGTEASDGERRLLMAAMQHARTRDAEPAVTSDGVAAAPLHLPAPLPGGVGDGERDAPASERGAA